MNKNRIDELMNAMNNSFAKEAYRKSEILDEMFELQKEIVGLTFNDEHSGNGDLRIWDVRRHLEQMNEENGHVADVELARFKEESFVLGNLISAEVSGFKGEQKAFRYLENLQSKNIVLKNIELTDGEHRTELDAIVITRSGITIVEVKNSHKNIFIDENGDYIRTGEFNSVDCNIAFKLSCKEEILRKNLEGCGVDNIEIRSILVFTDNRIEFRNKHNSVKACFLGQLKYLIDGYVTGRNISDEEMNKLADSIRNAECMFQYPAGFDVEEYKKNFAILMAKLEEPSRMVADDEGKEEAEKTRKHNFIETVRRVLVSRRYRAA